MKLGPTCRKVSRWMCVALLIMTSGGSTFVLSGCDPTLSTAALQGLGNLSTGLVQAVFTMLETKVTESQGTGTTNTTTTPTDTTTTT